MENIKDVSARTRLFSELATRYAPLSASQADREALDLKVEFMVKDTAHVPVLYIERAIVRWVREKAFFPKASELIQIGRDERNAVLKDRYGASTAQDRCDKMNEALRARSPDRARQVEWVVADGEPKLDLIRAQPVV